MNKQIIVAEIDGSENPCPDMAKDLSHAESFLYVALTGSPAKVGIIPVANEFQSQNLYVISEQAYKYFLSKCTEDELWDLGFLGCSEEHVRVANVPNVRL